MFGFVRKYLRIDEWLPSVLPLVMAAPLYAELQLKTSAAAGADAAGAGVGAAVSAAGAGVGAAATATGTATAAAAASPFATPGAFTASFALFFCFTFVFLAFGYLINDYSDIEEDRRAGKQKVIFDVPRPVNLVVLGVLVVLGMVLAGAASHMNPLALVLAVATYFLGAAYSIPQLRLKEKGVWGLVVSSFAQRGMPIIVAAPIFGLGALATLDWVALSFLNGLRYILVHQLVDLENDRITGTRTFVSVHGPTLARRGIDVILVVEVILLVPTVLKPACAAFLPLGILLIAAYLVLAIALYAVFFRVFGKRNVLYTYDLVPLEGFLNVVTPLWAALLLCPHGLAYVPIAVVFAAFGAVVLYPKLKNLSYVRHLRKSLI